MRFEYYIIMFIVIGFIYGLYRGIKRELSFFTVFSISVFLPLYLYDFIKSVMERIVNFSDIYPKLHVITDNFNISYGCFEFLCVYFVSFLMINIILNGILYLLIFNKVSIRRQSIRPMHRLLGGLLGLVVGLELSLAMMLCLNGIISVDMNGFISNLLQMLPKVPEFMSQTARVISEVA